MTTGGVQSGGSSGLTFQPTLRGMQRAEGQAGEAAAAVAGGDITSSRMVELVESERMYQANATMFRAQSELVGRLLDVRR